MQVMDEICYTPLLQYVDCAPKDCHADIAADGPWCLHRLMKLLLPDLLRLVLLAEDVTQVGVDVEALVCAILCVQKTLKNAN